MPQQPNTGVTTYAQLVQTGWLSASATRFGPGHTIARTTAELRSQFPNLTPRAIQTAIQAGRATAAAARRLQSGNTATPGGTSVSGYRYRVIVEIGPEGTAQGQGTGLPVTVRSSVVLTPGQVRGLAAAAAQRQINLGTGFTVAGVMELAESEGVDVYRTGAQWVIASYGF